MALQALQTFKAFQALQALQATQATQATEASAVLDGFNQPPKLLKAIANPTHRGAQAVVDPQLGNRTLPASLRGST